VRSIYEVRAALTIMKEQYRSQKVAAEEQLREKYVFTIKPPEIQQTVEVHGVEEVTVAGDDGICFFPLVPTQKEMWIIYRNSDGQELDASISEKKSEIEEGGKKLREVGQIVNGLKGKIDKLKEGLSEKEKNRLPPIDGVLVIDEDELQIRQELRDVKHQYKEAHQHFCELTENEERLRAEIEEEEQQLERDFMQWIEDRERQAVAETEEEEDNEELLDKEERRDKREYQKVIDQDPKAGPFFFAYKKVQKILEREFRANGTRRQPVTE
jgi:hypothetical protein